MESIFEQLINSNQTTILIVDDNFINLQIMSHILQSEPYKIITARNGIDAIELAKLNKPDLILLDLMMPVMNGFEVTENILNDSSTKDIPILFVTCKDSEDEIIKGYNAGAVDYITKPFNPEELKKRVRTHLTLNLLKEKIEKNENKLKDLIEEKKELMAVTIHDLKSPLYNIQMISKIMHEDETLTKSELKEYSQAIVNTSDRILDLIKNLLEFSLLDDGKMKYSPERFDISKIIENSLENYRIRAKEKEIILNYECKSANTVIFADPKLTYQVVDNLVSNVLKFSPRGKNAYIKLFEHNDSLQLEIQDEGPGLTEDDKKKLFHKFTKLSTRPTGDEFSTGLGLSIVKKYVESMNGKIWAESDGSSGAKFIVQLPKIFEENNKIAVL
jgi:two-component system, sensor histidine kinase and response regulator